MRGNIGFDKDDPRLTGLNNPFINYIKGYKTYIIDQFKVKGRLSRLDFLRYTIPVFLLLPLAAIYFPWEDIETGKNLNKATYLTIIEKRIFPFIYILWLIFLVLNFIRRFHDTGRSALWTFFPLGFASPWTYLSLFKKGDPYDNEYGSPNNILSLKPQ